MRGSENSGEYVLRITKVVRDRVHGRVEWTKKGSRNEPPGD